MTTIDTNTFTFTARSAEDPDKTATYTLHDGHVSIAFGQAFLEQVESAFEAIADDESESVLAKLIKPAATGSMQQVMRPIPLEDFDASTGGDNLHTVAWIRARGLRLAPILMRWQQVDNPPAARAFVEELQARKESLDIRDGWRAPADYWITWVVGGLLIVVMPLIGLRWLRSRETQH
jgi:hypothetical protein